MMNYPGVLNKEEVIKNFGGKKKESSMGTPDSAEKSTAIHLSLNDYRLRVLYEIRSIG
jgi:hypothetical protein